MTDNDDEMTLEDLWAEIEDLRNMIGDNEHPDDYVSEREDLAAFERDWERRTTPSQRAAMSDEPDTTTMFSPFIQDGVIFFETPEGEELPFSIQMGWSTITPGLPYLMIDTEPVAEPVSRDEEPQLRIDLNDATIYDPKENRP